MAREYQFERLPLPGRRDVRITVDGGEMVASAGDTVLTAVLTQRRSLRPFEFANENRAGFCLMGACQDCWVHDAASGERLRACSTPVAEGMAIVTTSGRRFHDA